MRPKLEPGSDSLIFHPNAKNVCYSGNVQFSLELPFNFLMLRIKSCMVWEVYVVCACARAHALNGLGQTMIAANSCMTLFLPFSLSLVHQLKVERAKPRLKYLPHEGRKRLRNLPNEGNEGATSPNKCSELQSS